MVAETLTISRQPDYADADTEVDDAWRRVYGATPPAHSEGHGASVDEVSVRLDSGGDVTVLSNPRACARPYGPLVVKVAVEGALGSTPEAVCSSLRCVAVDADGLSHSFDWRASGAAPDVLVITFVSPMSIRRMFRWAIETRLPAV